MSQAEEKDTNQSEEQTEAEKCSKERDLYLDGWRRAAAELENHKKQDIHRSAQASRAIKKNIFTELLPVLDSIERASQDATQDDKGIEMIKNQFIQLLEKNGIEKIQAESGQDFNPCLHEAVGEVDAGDGEDGLEGKIVEVVAHGYTLEDKTIRPARVVVGRSKEN